MEENQPEGGERGKKVRGEKKGRKEEDKDKEKKK